MNSESPRFQSPEFRALPSRILWQVIRFALIVLLSTTAYAQYGGMPGTTGMGTPTYGHGAAIGIGVGAAAGGVAAVYLLTHRTSKVSGCVRAADDGLRLTDDKTQKTLSLVNETLTSNQGRGWN